MRDFPHFNRFIFNAVFFVFIFTSAVFAEGHIFYTQPTVNARANLQFLSKHSSSGNKIVPLVGRYNILDGGNRDTLGQVNVPCIFRESRDIILQKTFARQTDAKAAYTFYFSGINGNIEIKVNGRTFFQGSQNFIPIEFSCPGYLLVERENVLEIHIRAWRGAANEFPQWIPVNFPAIFSGVTAPAYIEILPKNGIQKLSAKSVIRNDSLIISGKLFYQPGEDYPQQPLANIALSLKNKIIRQKRLYMPFDSTKTLQEFNFNLAIKGGKNWSAEHPDIHKLELRILRGRSVLATKQISVVSRKLEKSSHQLHINGEPLKISGINYVYQGKEGTALIQPPTILEDLKNIKRAGFNAIRLAYFPVNEIVFSIADSLGLYCFQDLPITLSKIISSKDSIRFNKQKTYFQQFLKMADRHPSLVGIGIKCSVPEQSSESSGWTELKKMTDDHRDYWLYACTNDYQSLENPQADFVCLDILERNRQGDELAKIARAMNTNSILIVSALSKPISYRMDSTAIVHDLKQIHELYIRFNKSGWQKKLGGQFLITYSDFILNTPSLQAGPQKKFVVNASGLYHLDRRLKKEAQTVLNKKYVEAIKSGVESEKTSVGTYIFTIIGLINFLLFLVFYRSSIEFRQNIKRSIKKPHGFFSDLQERRLIPLTENLFLILFMAVNGSVMISGLFYFFRNNFYMDYFISLFFFSNSTKSFIADIIWQPVLLVPFVAGCIILFVLFLVVPIRISAFFRPQIIRTRQALAVCAWAGTPFVFLLPFGMFFYNLLLLLNSYWILITVLLYFHAWYFLRWTNGARVLSELTYPRVLLLNILFILVLGSSSYYYLHHEIQIGKHLVYLFQLFRTLN